MRRGMEQFYPIHRGRQLEMMLKREVENPLARKRGAEHTLEGANPRFIVTSLKRTRIALHARFLYEQLYCARGEAENRIGEQFELFADRASSATMQANQLRMSFSAMAYVSSIPCAASVCATASSPMPPSRPFASSC